jgi:hypothetical protein
MIEQPDRQKTLYRPSNKGTPEERIKEGGAFEKKRSDGKWIKDEGAKRPPIEWEVRQLHMDQEHGWRPQQQGQ